MPVPNIFIAATQQNNGKTTLSLGLMGALHLHNKNMGYIKPVGQRVVAVGNVCVDEDALLIEKVFGTGTALQDMNPVTVGQGFTTDWIMQPRENRHELEEAIVKAYERASKDRDFMVIEGTGHAGVGSVLNLSNARVARLLGAPVVIVAPGGVGRPIDEVALNAELLAKEGVPLAGVVINKVQMSKYEHVRKLVRRGFENLGIKVLGVFPYDEVLTAPSVREIMEEIKGELANDGVEAQALNALAEHYVVGAMSTHQAMDYFKPGSVIITPSDREDIILAALGTASADRNRNMKTLAGMILTGKTMPHPAILDLIHSSRIPVLICHQDTYTTASQVHDLLAKIRADDFEKIDHATHLVGDYFDFASIYPDMA